MEFDKPGNRHCKVSAGTIRVFAVEHMRLTFMCLVLGHLQAEPLSPRYKMAVPWQ